MLTDLKWSSYRVLENFVPFPEQRKKCSPNGRVCEAIQVKNGRLYFQHSGLDFLLKSSNRSRNMEYVQVSGLQA